MLFSLLSARLVAALEFFSDLPESEVEEDLDDLAEEPVDRETCRIRTCHQRDHDREDVLHGLHHAFCAAHARCGRCTHRAVALGHREREVGGNTSADREDPLIRLCEVGHPKEIGVDREQHFGAGAEVLNRIAQQRKQPEDDDHLHDHRQTAASRAEVFFFIKLRHLGVQHFFVVGVLSLNLLHLGLDFRHIRRGLDLLGVQRIQGKLDDQRQHDQRDAVVSDEIVHPSQKHADWFS